MRASVVFTRTFLLVLPCELCQEHRAGAGISSSSTLEGLQAKKGSRYALSKTFLNGLKCLASVADEG